MRKIYCSFLSFRFEIFFVIERQLAGILAIVLTDILLDFRPFP